MATGVGTFLAVVWLIFIGFRQSQGLSLTVKGEECVYEEVEFDGDAISGNFVSVAGIRFWRSRNSGIDFSNFATKIRLAPIRAG
ncbi:hypothetical protein HHK36_001610 [Tetracentron sinense]|uniref:Uncharacterized protein n=1 Tax=Tetracentron sinense TaxID=13715 RepID=A0A834ZYF0_TETSI|nr:hypothetical protein HHK36_001610 [Tetracentron sinense]